MGQDAAGAGKAKNRTRICRAYSRFPSLKKTESFRLVFRKGRRFYGNQMSLFLLYNGTDENRLGIVISKKNGNSVVRHRFARLVKEVMRLHRDRMKPGYDLVVAANKKKTFEHAHSLNYAQTEEELLRLMTTAGVLTG